MTSRLCAAGILDARVFAAGANGVGSERPDAPISCQRIGGALPGCAGACRH